MIITEKVWLSEKEACEYTSLSRETIRKDRDSGKIKYRTKGSKLIYHVSDLDNYIEVTTTAYFPVSEMARKKYTK
jgi:excisionase family DNA binding protein